MKSYTFYFFSIFILFSTCKKEKSASPYQKWIGVWKLLKYDYKYTNINLGFVPYNSGGSVIFNNKKLTRYNYYYEYDTICRCPKPKSQQTTNYFEAEIISDIAKHDSFVIRETYFEKDSTGKILNTWKFMNGFLLKPNVNEYELYEYFYNQYAWEFKDETLTYHYSSPSVGSGGGLKYYWYRAFKKD